MRRIFVLQLGDLEKIVSPNSKSLTPDQKKLLTPVSGLPKAFDYDPSQHPRDEGGRWVDTGGGGGGGTGRKLDGAASQAWAKEHFGGLKLKAQESQSLDVYTKAPSFARAVREGNPKANKYVQHLDSAISKAKLPETVVAYRGVGENVFPAGKNMTGATFSDKSYVSTSFDKKMATEFRQQWSGVKGGTMMEITVPKGMAALPLEGIGKGIRNERELLLGRGTKFKITADKKENGIRYISAEVVR